MHKYVEKALNRLWDETVFPLTRRVFEDYDYDYYFVINKCKTTYTNEDEEEITEDGYDITLHDGARIVLRDCIGVTEERWNEMSDDFAIVLEQDINEKEEQSEEMEYFEEDDDPDEETIQ